MCAHEKMDGTMCAFKHKTDACNSIKINLIFIRILSFLREKNYMEHTSFFVKYLIFFCVDI